MAGFLDGSHVLFASHYHFLLRPIWLSICLVWSTQYISIAPLLPWQISGYWYLFPRCSFSCSVSEPEKKPFQLLINWLCGSSAWTRFFHPFAHSLIGQMLRSASWGFILFYLIENLIHEYCVCIIPTPSFSLPIASCVPLFHPNSVTSSLVIIGVCVCVCMCKITCKNYWVPLLLLFWICI